MTHARNFGNRDSAHGVAPDTASWVLRLTALSADEPKRLARFLTGALLACGGWILTRTTQGNQTAELDFQFARASCVEIYSVLIAAGLALSRDSHLQLSELCHCTSNLLESRALEIARIVLTIYRSNSAHGKDDYAPDMAA